MKDFLSFKFNQYNRLQREPMSLEELKVFVEHQMKTGGDLVLGFIREGIAAGAKL